jgi:hypothetical protein
VRRRRVRAPQSHGGVDGDNARFLPRVRVPDAEEAAAAAPALKFSVVELRTDAEKTLAAGAHVGVLKGSGGQPIIGSVASEVYRRIEEHVRKGASAPDASKPDNAAVATKTTSEQNMNLIGPARLSTAGSDLASRLPGAV